MAGARCCGPQGGQGDSTCIDSGSLVRSATPLPGVVDRHDDDRRLFDHAIQALEAELPNIGAHAAIDANARRLYSNQIRALAEELATEANAGRISWRQATERAARRSAARWPSD